ncbi:MAG: Hpt domain-containing protein [Phycisphaerae bacterium]|nr:Hpt domain-containing protein [Phycisphaerae bacterium]
MKTFDDLGTGEKSALVSELSNDADMIELVEFFIAELPKRVGAMSEALAARDWATLARVAHQLKGAAGGYGFPAITDAAGALEESIKASESIDRLAGHLRQVADLCERARARN